MKHSFLLNRDLSHLIATLGHVDEVVIADAGMPAPKGVPVIDLALSRGVPSFWQVCAAIRSELVIEGAVIASETSDELLKQMQGELAQWTTTAGHHPVPITRLSHDALKQRSGLAKAFVRTGEATPYCNMTVICGVAF